MFFVKTAEQRNKNFQSKLADVGNKNRTIVLSYLVVTLGEGKSEEKGMYFEGITTMMAKSRKNIIVQELITSIPLHKKHEYVNQFKDMLGVN